MPALLATLVGAIVGGLTQFVTTRLGAILVGAGLMFVSFKGLENVIAFAVADIYTVVQVVQNSGGSIGGGMDGLKNIGALMIAFASYAGLFDAANILLSGYASAVALARIRIGLTRLTG